MAQTQQNDSFRWWVLVATSMGMFAYGYAYDNVVALQRQLLTTYDLSNVQYNLLYSIYAFPNMILPTIAGILSDKYGYNFLLIFLFGLMVFGQAIYVFGCYLHGIYYVLLLGRLVLGIGAESHALVETPFIYDYFKGKELAFALALHLSLARAGSSLNDVGSYLAYKYFKGSENMKIVFAASIALLVLFVFWIGIITVILIHKARVKNKKSLERMARKESNKNISSTSSIAGVANPNMDASLQFNLLDNKHETASVTSYSTVASKMKISDIRDFGLLFWLLTWNCSIMYAIVMSWMNIGSDFLQTTYGYSHGTANVILTIPYSLAAVLQPIWGWTADKYGRRSQMLFIASLLFVVAHYILGWVHQKDNPIYVPIIALIILGTGFSVFTAIIWSCYPFVVPARAIATAYGIPVSGYNLVTTIYFVLVGELTSSVDNADKYSNVQYFLLITSISSVVTSLWLLYKDKQTGSRLNQPSYQQGKTES